MRRKLTWNEEQRNIAMRNAKSAAKQGESWWASYWQQRAEQFAPVAKREKTITKNLLAKALE